MPSRSTLLAAASAFAALASGGATLAAEAASAAAATWQKHEYRFQYMGFTSTYSCDGLADQLQKLLTQAGARADAKATPGACAAAFGRPDKFSNATLVFYTLAPAGPAAPGGDAVLGQWTDAQISPRHPTGLQTGDCELVEQFRDLVLKKMFTIRNLEDNTRCVPHQESGSLVSLRFQSLTAAPGEARAPAPSATAAPLFVYPARGQSAQQQATDRTECESSAGPADGLAPAAAEARNGAVRACLLNRGYSAR